MAAKGENKQLDLGSERVIKRHDHKHNWKTHISARFRHHNSEEIPALSTVYH